MIPLLKCKQNQDPLAVDRHPLVIPVADQQTLLDRHPLVIPVSVVDQPIDRHPLVIPVAVVDQWTPVLLPPRLRVRI